MIEMVRDAAEPKGRDRFSCSNAVWKMLQELGRSHGWQPRGATYTARESLQTNASIRHDYLAGGPLDCKRLDAEDAVAWARALDAAKQSAQFVALLEQGSRGEAGHGAVSIETLYSLVYEFTQFAYGGAFTFAESRNSED